MVDSESGQMRASCGVPQRLYGRRSSSWYPYGTIASNRAGPPVVRAARSALASGGRDVLVQPEEVLGVVAALDLGQPVVGSARVGGADPRLALVAEEVDVGAAVGLQNRAQQLPHPRHLLRSILLALVERGDV